MFSSKLICGDCGGQYGAKVWHSTDKYRCIRLQCNQKYKTEPKCKTPNLTEDEVKRRFVSMWNRLLINRTQLIDDCRLIQHELAQTDEIDAELEKNRIELETVVALVKKMTDENASHDFDQDAYAQQYNEYNERYNAAAARIKQLKSKRSSQLAKADAVGAMIFRLQETDEPVTVFDDLLFMLVVEHVIVFPDTSLKFVLKSGVEVF